MDPYQIVLLVSLVVGHGLLFFRDIRHALRTRGNLGTLYDAFDMAIDMAMKYSYDDTARMLHVARVALDEQDLLIACKAMYFAALHVPEPFEMYLEDIVGKRFRAHLEDRSAFLEDW